MILENLLFTFFVLINIGALELLAKRIEEQEKSRVVDFQKIARRHHESTFSKN